MKKTLGIILGIALLVFCFCCGADMVYRAADVAGEIAEADGLREQGKYEESLNIYQDAMHKNPGAVNAWIGAVRCRIVLEDYDAALEQIEDAVEIWPERTEFYEMYLEAGRLTEDMETMRAAVRLADENQAESFLAGLPGMPELSYESGSYTQKLELEISTGEQDAGIYYTIQQEDGQKGENTPYTAPVKILNGETVVEAWCVRNGIPGRTVTGEYHCEYEPTEIAFADPVMERLIREALDRPRGAITDADCEEITELNTMGLYEDAGKTEDQEALKIHSLKDLKWLPGLTHLYISGQDEIRDFSEIGICGRLTVLQICSSALEDLSFLSRLPLLSDLYLSGNNISDVSALADCPNIRCLSIEGNPVTDLSGLTALSHLLSLSMDDDHLKDYSLLREWEELSYLHIYGLEDLDYDALGELPGLADLGIHWDQGEKRYYSERTWITDLTFLEKLTGLSYLSIEGLQNMSGTDCIGKLTGLQYLSLTNRRELDREKDAAAVEELQKALPDCRIVY